MTGTDKNSGYLPEEFESLTRLQVSEPSHDPSVDIDKKTLSAETELLVDVEGFEGPMDLLLHLARRQKVDLTHISVLQLAVQYLQYVEIARKRQLELAADYLVMAAWLTYLKSRLLVPKQRDDDGSTGEELAEILHFRLKRLEAMRNMAQALVDGRLLGRDVFARGMPEAVIVETISRHKVTLYELLIAYTSQRQRQAASHVEIMHRKVWSLKEARVVLTRLIGEVEDWQDLEQFLAEFIATPKERASVLASSFAASLELVREGRLEIQQHSNFAPIYMRKANRVNADGS